MFHEINSKQRWKHECLLSHFASVRFLHCIYSQIGFPMFCAMNPAWLVFSINISFLVEEKKCLQIKVTGHLSWGWFFLKYMFSLYQTFVCMNLLILPSLFNRWVWGVIHFLLEIWYCKGLVFTVIDNRHVQPLAVLCTVRFDCTNSILM